MVKKKEETKTLNYMNWDRFFLDFNSNLQKTSEFGVLVYFDSTLINQYFSQMNQFYILYKEYLREDTNLKIKDRLKEIRIKLFSEEYILELKKTTIKKNNLSKIQNKTLLALDEILSVMISDFSKNALIPRLEVLQKKDINNSVFG